MSTNVSSVVSHFPDAENGFSTATSGSVSSGATTVGLNSVAGYTNGQPAVFVIDPTDASKKQTFTGIVDTAGVQITSVVWTAGTNQAHALGATVVDYATATHIAMISKGAQVEHSQAGTHTNITQADANFIKDTSGNELLKWSTTASAVNEVTIKNAATGTAPIIKASGGDSAANLNLQGKGLAKTVTIGVGGVTIFPYDYVASGLVISGDSYGSTLKWSVTAGVVVINGSPLSVAALSAQDVTASKDTYIDVLDAGDGTGTIVFTGGNVVTNNAASPALAANSIRIGIIVSGAGNIAAVGSVNQGQENKVLPIASSIPYAVTDSLGNLICPRDPNRKVLGYRQITSNFTSAGGATATQITGLSCPVIIPTGRKIEIDVFASWHSAAATGASFVTTSIWNGVVNSGTQIANTQPNLITSGTTQESVKVEAMTSAYTGSQTFNAGTAASNTNNATYGAGATFPMFIRVRLA